MFFKRCYGVLLMFTMYLVFQTVFEIYSFSFFKSDVLRGYFYSLRQYDYDSSSVNCYGTREALKYRFPDLAFYSKSVFCNSVWFGPSLLATYWIQM